MTASAAALAHTAMRRSFSAESLQRLVRASAWQPAAKQLQHSSSAVDLRNCGRKQGTDSCGMPPLRLGAGHAELWGAANAVTAALMPVPRTPRGQVSTAAAAAAAPAAEPAPPSSALREALDFRPTLRAGQALAAVSSAWLLAFAVFSLTAPAGAPSRAYVIAIAGCYVSAIVVMRSWLLERQYKAVLRPAQSLGDDDSVFRSIDGLVVHYKLRRCLDAAKPPLALHAYHGFGANTGSWMGVHALLAQRLAAQVTKHDMPGFGLTERTSDMSWYTLAVNGAIGRRVMDSELAAAGLLPAEQGRAAVQAPLSGAGKPQSAPSTMLAMNADASSAAGRLQRVLMGHSLGASCVAEEVIAHPQGVSAIVLVAPAIIAMPADFLPWRPAGRVGCTQQEGSGLETSFGSATPPRPSAHRSAPRQALRLAAALARTAGVAALRAALWLAQPLLVLVLRLAVRRRAFWERGLGSAWHRRGGLTPDTVDAYRRPQLVRGWEKGIVRFLLARLTQSKSLAEVLRDTYRGKDQPGQAQQLAAAVQQHGIKVLIVHGSQDALVPAANSRRLASMLPGAQLEEFDACGHVPHEESPQQFCSTLCRFLAR